MLNKVRRKIGIILALKSAAMIESGEFEKILKGLDYFKYSLLIMPLTSNERRTILSGFKKIVDDNKTA